MSGPGITGPRVTPAERLKALAFARAWRIANKPYFDAIYGPEQERRECAHCDGTGFTLHERGAA